jgi:hypothetical protein
MPNSNPASVSACPPSSEHERLYSLIMAGWGSQTVRAMATLLIADHLAERELSAAELAERTSCEPSAMYRLLRAATSLGLARFNDEKQTFSGTPLLAVLQTGSPFSLKHYAQAAIGPAFWLPALNLANAVRDGTPQAETQLGSTVFEWMAANPREAAEFTAAMSDQPGPRSRFRRQHPGVAAGHPSRHGLVVTPGELPGITETSGQIESFKYLHDLLGRLQVGPSLELGCVRHTQGDRGGTTHRGTPADEQQDERGNLMAATGE